MGTRKNKRETVDYIGDECGDGMGLNSDKSEFNQKKFNFYINNNYILNVLKILPDDDEALRIVLYWLKKRFLYIPY